MVKVTDVSGRNIYNAKGMGLQVFSFGESFVAGVNLVEERQGSNVETVEAMKLNEDNFCL